MIVYNDIMDGDLLEYHGRRLPWVVNPIAFYSEEYTEGNKKEGQLSFRVSGFKYWSEYDCHSLPASDFTKKVLNIVGDDDDDCV